MYFKNLLVDRLIKGRKERMGEFSISGWITRGHSVPVASSWEPVTTMCVTESQALWMPMNSRPSAAAPMTNSASWIVVRRKTAASARAV